MGAACTWEEIVAERKSLLLRLDPAVHDALARWAADELRSTNAQIEFLLRRALAEAGRLPRHVGPMPRRGRPAAHLTHAGGDANREGDEVRHPRTVGQPAVEPRPGPEP
jgi:hypothetical protein